MQYSYNKVDENKIKSYLNEFKYGNVNIYGTVQDDPDITEDRIRMLVSADSLSQGLNSYKYSGTVLLSIYKNNRIEE